MGLSVLLSIEFSGKHGTVVKTNAAGEGMEQILEADPAAAEERWQF